MSRPWQSGALALALAGALVAGCTGSAVPPGGGAGAGAAPVALEAAAARAWLAERPQALVLDVRTAAEWNDDLGHIEGSRQIPVGELERRLDELEPWRERPVLVVCRVGGRSAHAARVLARAGFTDVRDLAGGLVAWRRAGY